MQGPPGVSAAPLPSHANPAVSPASSPPIPKLPIAGVPTAVVISKHHRKIRPVESESITSENKSKKADATPSPDESTASTAATGEEKQHTIGNLSKREQKLITRLQKISRPTFRKFFDKAWKHEDPLPPVVITSVASKFLAALSESQFKMDAINRLLNTTFLFQSCIDRWQRIHELFKFYVKHVDPKKRKDKPSKIVKLKACLSQLTGLKAGGLQKFLKVLEAHSLQSKAVKKYVAMGLCTDSSEQKYYHQLLQETYDECQNLLIKMSTSVSYTMTTHTPTSKTTQPKKEMRGRKESAYKSPHPSPKASMKSQHTENLMSGSGSESKK